MGWAGYERCRVGFIVLGILDELCASIARAIWKGFLEIAIFI